MEAAIISAIGINTKLQKCTLKATEWKPSERGTERLRYGYRIGPEGDGKYSPSIITQISQRRISLPKDFTWRSNKRITGGPTRQSHCWRCLPNGILKDQETMAERHTEHLTEWNPEAPYRRPTKCLPRSQRIFYRSCLPRWPQRSRPRSLPRS
jgi:hypothetical protein